ncbi:MAG: hypothetical protein Q8P82_02460 [bacterium]|nr:hypothetical protein [bacterium]
MIWYKRLLLFVAAAALGIVAAALFARAGMISIWLVQVHAYLHGSLDTSIGTSGSIPTIIIAFLIGINMTATPCFSPMLNAFLPSTRNKELGSWLARITAFSLAVIIESVLLGILFSFLGAFAWQRLFAFTESTGKTALTLFGFFGIIILMFSLGDFGLMHPMNWMGNAFHRAERRIIRLRGFAKFFLHGLISGGILGVGCPYPIYQALFLWIVISGNILLGATALAAFAAGRIIPLFLLIIIDLHYQKPNPLIIIITKMYRVTPLINGIILALVGTFFFIFWWIYVSVFAFGYA